MTEADNAIRPGALSTRLALIAERSALPAVVEIDCSRPAGSTAIIDTLEVGFFFELLLARYTQPGER